MNTLPQPAGWPPRPQSLGKYYVPITRKNGEPGWQFDTSLCQPLGRMRARDAAPQRTQQARLDRLNEVYRERLGKPYEPPQNAGPTGRPTSVSAIIEASEKERRSHTTDGPSMNFEDQLRLQCFLNGPVFFGSDR